MLSRCCGFDVPLPFIFPVLRGIDSLLDEFAGCISGRSGFSKAYFGVGANGKKVLFPVESELPAPELATRLFDGEKKPAAIAEFVSVGCGLGCPDLGVREKVFGYLGILLASGIPPLITSHTPNPTPCFSGIP